MVTTKSRILDIILYISAFILLAGAGFTWYYFGQLNNELALKVAGQKQELAAAQKRVALLEELRKNSELVKVERERLAAFIPNKEGQEHFILELERISQKCDLEIENCVLDGAPKKIAGFPKYNVYQWRVRFAGDYQGLLAFLDELPKANRFVAVSDLDTKITVGTSKSQVALAINCTLDLVTTASGEKVVK